MHDQATKQKFIELRANGISYDKISSEINVSKQTLINWAKEFHNEINNLQVIELDSMKEQFYASKRKRLELFSKQIETIQNEITTRVKDEELYKIEGSKLFDLLIRFSTLIKIEYNGLEFKGPDSPTIDFGSTWQAG